MLPTAAPRLVTARSYEPAGDRLDVPSSVRVKVGRASVSPAARVGVPILAVLQPSGVEGGHQGQGRERTCQRRTYQQRSSGRARHP